MNKVVGSWVGFDRILSRVFLLLAVQVQSQCQVHEECDDPQICHQGSCQNACRFQTCGLNAICVAQNHVAECQCLPNYFSDNPNAGCQTSKCMCCFFMKHVVCEYILSPSARPSTEPLEIGCASNEDCPDYAACQNTHCINPCAVRDPCAPLATCRVVNHAPVCTCPDGYIGSPEVECRPRKLC